MFEARAFELRGPVLAHFKGLPHYCGLGRVEKEGLNFSYHLRFAHEYEEYASVHFHELEIRANDTDELRKNLIDTRCNYAMRALRVNTVSEELRDALGERMDGI